MKRILIAIPMTLSMFFFGACNNGQDGPAYDPAIVVPHKDSVSQTTAGSQAVAIPADSTQAIQLNGQPQPVVAASAQPVAAGMNPAHGQPGHRCDIAVGAPLNSPPGKQTAPSTQTITPTTNTTAKTKTAPGMNPPHGEPGHRCDISVGAPLNSPPNKQAAVPTITTPAKTDNSKADAAPASSANTGEEKKP